MRCGSNDTSLLIESLKRRQNDGCRNDDATLSLSSQLAICVVLVVVACDYLKPKSNFGTRFARAWLRCEAAGIRFKIAR
jgi:hypothetical protein